MGITNLWKYLKSISKSTNLEALCASITAGQTTKRATVAVDAMCWLHRSSYTCCAEIVEQRSTTKYLTFLRYFVRLVKRFATPILVFDGCELGMKSALNAARRTERNANRLKGQELFREGKAQEAFEYYRRAIQITPEMVRSFQALLRHEGVEFIVAPYEADAQIAYLFKQGLVDFCITEDSDLLAFGCTKAFTKMDRHGNGVLVDLTAVARITREERDQHDKFVTAMIKWNDSTFKDMCVLSGCDYLPSIRGMGLKRVTKILLTNGDSMALQAQELMVKYACKMDNVLEWLRLNRAAQMPQNYREQFKKARLTFQHQYVYDPESKSCVHLNPLPAAEAAMSGVEFKGDKFGLLKADDKLYEDLSFLSERFSDEIAEGLATGQLDPRTRKAWPEEMQLVDPSALDAKQSAASSPAAEPAQRYSSRSYSNNSSNSNSASRSDSPAEPAASRTWTNSSGSKPRSGSKGDAKSGPKAAAAHVRVYAHDPDGDMKLLEELLGGVTLPRKPSASVPHSSSNNARSGPPKPATVPGADSSSKMSNADVLADLLGQRPSTEARKPSNSDLTPTEPMDDAGDDAGGEQRQRKHSNSSSSNANSSRPFLVRTLSSQPQQPPPQSQPAPPAQSSPQSPSEETQSPTGSPVRPLNPFAAHLRPAAVQKRFTHSMQQAAVQMTVQKPEPVRIDLSRDDPGEAENQSPEVVQAPARAESKSSKSSSSGSKAKQKVAAEFITPTVRKTSSFMNMAVEGSGSPTRKRKAESEPPAANKRSKSAGGAAAARTEDDPKRTLLAFFSRAA